jgi:hypothetical protein
MPSVLRSEIYPVRTAQLMIHGKKVNTEMEVREYKELRKIVLSG